MIPMVEGLDHRAEVCIQADPSGPGLPASLSVCGLTGLL